jgi:hypothetical protein
VALIAEYRGVGEKDSQSGKKEAGQAANCRSGRDQIVDAFEQPIAEVEERGPDSPGPSNSLVAQARSYGRITMDRDTKATLHRKNMRTESDKMTTNGKIEDLVRQFMILPKETRREYSIAVGEREYEFREIENLAREFGIEEN